MDSQQRRSRTRRLAFIATAVVASAALAAGPGFAAGGDGDAVTPAPVPAAAASPTPPPQPPEVPVKEPVHVDPVKPKPVGDVPAFGAYLDYGPNGVNRIEELSDWLGGADLRVGHTYLPGDRWSNIEGRPEFLRPWAQWRKEREDRMLVLNVPMLERNEEGLSDSSVRRLLRNGASGLYDHHFRRLAERLVSLGAPDTVVVLGWEMNGITYTHRCAPDPEAWKTYWKRIVTAMRGVEGQRFRFDFAPSRGQDAIGWTQCYPGDAHVDIIGMDSYDQPAGITFDQQIEEPFGLRRHVEFAKEHGKPISYPEWGLFRNGDNPEYMRRMLEWIEEHQPLYHTLTDYCPHGVWQCDRNPKAAEVYRAMLSGTGTGAETPAPQPTAPEPSPDATTPAPTPSRPADCTPLDLGEWVEYWIGGKLCMRFDWWTRTR